MLNTVCSQYNTVLVFVQQSNSAGRISAIPYQPLFFPRSHPIGEPSPYYPVVARRARVRAPTQIR